MSNGMQPVKVGDSTYDLSGTVSIADARKDVPGYLETLRVNLTDAYEHAKTVAEKQVILEKGAKDIEETIKAHEKALAEMANSLRTVPNASEAKDGKAKLHGVNLWNKPGDLDVLDSKSGFTGAFDQLTPLQYNLLLRTSDDLGIEDDKTRKKVARLQAIHNEMALQIAYLTRRPTQNFLRHGWECLPKAEEYKRLSKELIEAAHEARLGTAVIVEGTTGSFTDQPLGGNWVPQQILSPNIFPVIEYEYQLRNAFNVVQMAGPIWDAGVVGSRMYSTKFAEQNDDAGGTVMTPQTITAKKLRLQAVLHASFAFATPQWLQDNVSGSSFIMSELAQSILRGEESWWVNGQATALLDTALTIAASDARNLGNGLRYWYNQMKGAGIVGDVDASAGLTSEALAKAYGQQRRYSNPARNVWITGTIGMAQLLVLKSQSGQGVVQTIMDIGPKATILTGSLAAVLGSPVIVSNEISEAMTAGGLVDNLSTNTQILRVNTDAVLRGERAGVMVEFSDQYRFAQYQDAYRATAREAFTNVYDPLTEPFISNIVGVKAL
jgi:hypothetical protein